MVYSRTARLVREQPADPEREPGRAATAERSRLNSAKSGERVGRQQSAGEVDGRRDFGLAHPGKADALE